MELKIKIKKQFGNERVNQLKICYTIYFIDSEGIRLVH